MLNVDGLSESYTRRDFAAEKTRSRRFAVRQRACTVISEWIQISPTATATFRYLPVYLIKTTHSHKCILLQVLKTLFVILPVM